MNTARNIAHHLSEKTFRFYEPYLTLGVRNFPEETSWDVGTLRAQDPSIKIGPNTFVGRFRDAIVSLRRFSWDTTVDVPKLISIAGLFVISLQPGTSVVWFKNRASRGRPLTLIAESRTHPLMQGVAPSPVLWKDITNEELEALTLLISNGRLHGPFLTSREIDSAYVINLTSSYNIAITWDAERGVTVIT